MDKTCFKCGAVKDIEDFYKHPQMGDGHFGKCKECTKKDARERNILKNDYVRAYDKARFWQPSRVALRKILSAREKNERPERYRARYALSNAVRDGRIVKSRVCEICGATDIKTHGHHYDYSRPLDVIWLCVVCHQQIH